MTNKGKTVSKTKSLTIGIRELEELKKFIILTNIPREPVKSQYELLRINYDDVRIILYKSGKLVYSENKNTLDIINNILLQDTGYDYYLGSDETGKGEWYGPLVACCVALESKMLKELRMLGVRDSKSIPKNELMKLANKIIKLKPLYRTVILDPPKYNTMYFDFKKEEKSLNDLLAWAHSAAIKKVIDRLSFNKIKLVIDKFDVEKTYRRLYSLDESKIEIIQKSKGESEIPVATSSILAKRTFEVSIDELDKKYGTDLRHSKPENIDKSILPYVAKLHFKNVNKALKN